MQRADILKSKRELNFESLKDVLLCTVFQHPCNNKLKYKGRCQEVLKFGLSVIKNK